MRRIPPTPGTSVEIRFTQQVKPMTMMLDKMVETKFLWVEAVVKYVDDTQFTAFVKHPSMGGLMAFRVDSDQWRVPK